MCTSEQAIVRLLDNLYDNMRLRCGNQPIVECA